MKAKRVAKAVKKIDGRSLRFKTPAQKRAILKAAGYPIKPSKKTTKRTKR